tara:strand:- start:211 stop:1230 length:1020 start_codon:yes stop_codon:yes gene_type:complete
MPTSPNTKHIQQALAEVNKVRKTLVFFACLLTAIFIYLAFLLFTYYLPPSILFGFIAAVMLFAYAYVRYTAYYRRTLLNACIQTLELDLKCHCSATPPVSTGIYIKPKIPALTTLFNKAKKSQMLFTRKRKQTRLSRFLSLLGTHNQQKFELLEIDTNHSRQHYRSSHHLSYKNIFICSPLKKPITDAVQILPYKVEMAFSIFSDKPTKKVSRKTPSRFLSKDEVPLPKELKTKGYHVYSKDLKLAQSLATQECLDLLSQLSKELGGAISLHYTSKELQILIAPFRKNYERGTKYPKASLFYPVLFFRAPTQATIKQTGRNLKKLLELPEQLKTSAGKK